MYNGFGAYPADDMDMGINSYFGESDTNFVGDTSNDSFFGEGCDFTGFGNGEFFNESAGFATDGSEVISENAGFSTDGSNFFVEGGGFLGDAEPVPKQKPVISQKQINKLDMAHNHRQQANMLANDAANKRKKADEADNAGEYVRAHRLRNDADEYDSYSKYSRDNANDMVKDMRTKWKRGTKKSDTGELT
jgi:hypothetical protein